MIYDVISVIAQAAQEKRPLAPALRELGTSLANQVADRLDDGATLPTALQGALDPELANLLAGPQPNTADAALLVVDWLRLKTADRIIAVERLTHPLCALCLLSVTIVLVGLLGPAPNAAWLAAGGMLISGAVLIICAIAGRWQTSLPFLAGSLRHGQLATSYARAALVARWKLPEDQLLPLLGDALTRLSPILADPGAEEHCRRLAAYHRAAELRARLRLWSVIMSMGYLAGGCLLLAAGLPLVDNWLTILTDIHQHNFLNEN